MLSRHRIIGGAGAITATVAAAKVSKAGGCSYSNAGLLLQAAVAGQGVALARSVLARSDLVAGSPIRLFDIQVPAKSSYYLVYRAVSR